MKKKYAKLPFQPCTHHTVPGCCYGSAPWPDWPPVSTMGWGRRKSGCLGGEWTRCTRWSRISSLHPHKAAGQSDCSVWPRGVTYSRFISICGIQGVLTQTWLYLHHSWRGTDIQCGYIALILQYEALNAGALEARDTVEVVHSDCEVVTRRPLFHQDIGAFVEKIKRHTLEGDVVGIAIEVAATWKQKIYTTDD